MTTPNWPGLAGHPSLPSRLAFARKSIQLPFATVNGETDAPEILWGSGTPNGAIVGSPPDLFLSSDQGLWMKGSGINTNTGWIQISSLAGSGMQDMEWVSEPGYAGSAIDTNWGGWGYLMGALPSGPTLGGIWSLFGQFPVVRKPTGFDENWLDVTPSATSLSLSVFRPITGTVDMVDLFFNAAAMVAGGAGRPPRAYQISARIMKKSAGDTVQKRFWFGFINVTDAAGNGFARRSCMSGLIGDGLGGFEFASVNTPDALNSGAPPNQHTTTVVGAVQPGVLVAPGVNALDVTIKAVPPVPGGAGAQIACYLGNARQALYTTEVQFPRTSVSSIDVFNAKYFGIQPAFAVYPNPDGVTVDKGIYLRDLRVKITSNLDVGTVLQT